MCRHLKPELDSTCLGTARAESWENPGSASAGTEKTVGSKAGWGAGKADISPRAAALFSFRPAGTIAVNSFQWGNASCLPAHALGISAVTMQFYSG